MEELLSTAESQKINHNIIREILSWLDGEGLKSARLVSRSWNTVALSMFKTRINLVPFQKQKDLELSRIMSASDEIFECINFTNTDSNMKNKSFIVITKPDSSGESVQAISNFNSMGTACPKFQVVTSVKLYEGMQIQTLISIANKGSLPNLREIFVQTFPTFKQAYQEIPKQSSLQNVRVLHLNVKPRTDEHHKFYQRMISAAQNLTELKIFGVYSLVKIANLQKLVIGADKAGQNGQIYHPVFSAVNSTLRSLTIQAIPFRWNFPVFQNVEDLHLLEMESHIDGNFTIQHYFPSLRRLMVDEILTLENTLTQTISLDLSTLQLEIKYPSSSWMLDKTLLCSLPEIVPNLKLLNVSIKNPPNSSIADVDTSCRDVVNCLLNLSLKMITITLENVEVAKQFIDSMKDFVLNVPEKIRMGKRLEIVNDNERRKGEDVSLHFATLIPCLRTLSRRWENVHFKFFKVTTDEMDLLREFRNENIFQVEVFGNL